MLKYELRTLYLLILTSVFDIMNKCFLRAIKIGTWRSLASALAWGARGRSSSLLVPTFKMYKKTNEKTSIYIEVFFISVKG